MPLPAAIIMIGRDWSVGSLKGEHRFLLTAGDEAIE
jgi:hypothetical protein